MPKRSDAEVVEPGASPSVAAKAELERQEMKGRVGRAEASYAAQDESSTRCIAYEHVGSRGPKAVQRSKYIAATAALSRCLHA